MWFPHKPIRKQLENIARHKETMWNTIGKPLGNSGEQKETSCSSVKKQLGRQTNTEEGNSTNTLARTEHSRQGTKRKEDITKTKRKAKRRNADNK